MVLKRQRRSYKRFKLIIAFVIVNALFGIAIGFLGLIYALLVPGGAMWLLTVKRTNFHDFYDLFKPPLVASALFILLLTLKVLLDFRLPFTFSDQESIPFLPLLMSIIVGAVFSFIGLGISELIHRILKKTKP